MTNIQKIIKIQNKMKTRIIITLAFFSLLANGQNSTVVFYSILNKKLNSRQNAVLYCEIKKNKSGLITQSEYSLRDNKWVNYDEIEIQKQTDTSFAYFSINNPKKIYTRAFFRIDSGYKIRNYLNNILTEEGISTCIFPLIKQGKWTFYNELSGKIRLESIYSDNLTITNKYYIPGGSFIKDVFTSTEKTTSL
jgi:hypothetical protein